MCLSWLNYMAHFLPAFALKAVKDTEPNFMHPQQKHFTAPDFQHLPKSV